MEKPRHISSEEARRWNEDVERRRLAHHERRCAEDAMYRRAYEYQQAEEQRMWSQMHKPFADMMAAAAEIRAQLTETKDGSHVFMPAECVAQQIEPNVDTEIGEWTYCNKPYGEKIPGLSISNCDIFAIWGYIRGGAFPIREQLVNVMDNKPRFYGECDDDIRPDILVAYHELPNMYDEEFLSLES